VYVAYQFRVEYTNKDICSYCTVINPHTIEEADYNNNNNNNIYLLQLGCYPVAVVILHVNKHEIGYY